MLSCRLNIPIEAVEAICLRHHVRELAVFGSALRDDFRPDSDVDFLVEFGPDASVGYPELFRMEDELGDAVDRKVDIIPKDGLNPSLRDEVLAQAQVIYAARDSVFA